MSNYGKFNPDNINNTSSLFVYKEIPLTSVKLNRWNGNISAAFEALHAVCALLFTSNTQAVLTDGVSTPLQVIAANPPDMTVQINPGWAVFDETLAGTKELITLPIGGFFSAPVNHPRIDLIALTHEGELIIETGTESATPTPPDTPAHTLALAQIYHRIGATQILANDDGIQSYIIDVRPTVVLGEAHRHAPDRVPSEAPDGSRTVFSTSATYRENSLDVFLNGVLMKKDVDYTENADRRGYTFLTAPPAHYSIQHRYIIEHE